MKIVYVYSGRYGNCLIYLLGPLSFPAGRYCCGTAHWYWIL